MGNTFRILAGGVYAVEGVFGDGRAPAQYDLGYIDLEQKTLQPLDNPFGTRVSPMS